MNAAAYAALTEKEKLFADLLFGIKELLETLIAMEAE